MSKKPVRVAVTGAAGQIGYALLFRIASGEMLGKDQPVILQLLEIPDEKAQKALKGVMMELEDCAFPLLVGMEAHSDPMTAFKDTDYALLVGARPRGPGMERADLLAANAQIFTAQGKALDAAASRNVKVLVVGNPAAHKNLAALTSAATILGQRSLTLAVAGTADPAVFRAGGGPAADAGLILGRVSDAELRALYENALCLIFPSRYEGFGLPPLEAMTCSCPVIAAHAGAVPEVCGEAALWFDPLRPETLAEAMERLLDEEGLAAGMRDAGLKRAAHYTWEKAALALLSLVRKNAP